MAPVKFWLKQILPSFKRSDFSKGRLLVLGYHLFFIGWFVLSVHGWVESPPWGWVAIGVYLFIILVNAYNFGVTTAMRRSNKLVEDQMALIKSMEAQLGKTYTLPVLFFIEPEEGKSLQDPVQFARIHWGVSLN
jgi:hypothetical protein